MYRLSQIINHSISLSMFLLSSLHLSVLNYTRLTAETTSCSSNNSFLAFSASLSALCNASFVLCLSSVSIKTPSKAIGEPSALRDSLSAALPNYLPDVSYTFVSFSHIGRLYYGWKNFSRCFQ